MDKIIKQGWWESSVDKGICRQAWGPGFLYQDPHKRRRNEFPRLSSDIHSHALKHAHRHMHTCTHIHTGTGRREFSALTSCVTGEMPYSSVSSSSTFKGTLIAFVL